MANEISENGKDHWKKLLKEVDISSSDVESRQILRAVCTEPDVFQQVDPPAGYENQLLYNLKMQGAFRSAPKIKDPSRVSKPFFGGWKFTSLSMGLSLTLGVVIALFVGKTNIWNPKAMTQLDFLVSESRGLDHNELDLWLASVGDSALRMDLTSKDVQVLAFQVDRILEGDLKNETLSDISDGLKKTQLNF